MSLAITADQEKISLPRRLGELLPGIAILTLGIVIAVQPWLPA